MQAREFKQTHIDGWHSDPVFIAIIVQDMATLCLIYFVNRPWKPGMLSLPVHLNPPAQPRSSRFAQAGGTDSVMVRRGNLSLETLIKQLRECQRAVIHHVVGTVEFVAIAPDLRERAHLEYQL